MRKETGEWRQREADMKGLVDWPTSTPSMQSSAVRDRNEQYSRLWKLKLFFIPEKAGPAPETPEE